MGGFVGQAIEKAKSWHILNVILINLFMYESFVENLKEFFALVTLPTLVGAAIYFGRKLQVLDQLNKSMSIVKKNIKVISNALVVAREVEWDGTLLRDYSPLSLTPEGEEYLAKTGFIDIFIENKLLFFNFIREEEPATKYDVENLALQSVLFLIDAEFMQPIKVYLYNHPKDNIQSFAKVAGVYVRDQYLEENVEIAK